MAYTYLITGATSDVGAALIRHLLTEAPGEDRTILAQGCGDLARLDALVQQFPGRIVTFDADLSSPEAVDALCARFGKDLPCPTHFVHLPALPVVNAKFKAFDEARFQKDWEIQVHSAVKLCKAVLPAMSKAKFGRVLFIQTSYTIGCPPKNTAAYVMNKSAIGGLVKSLAVEYARFGITVNCVAPGVIDTDMNSCYDSTVMEELALSSPLGRIGTPLDVAEAVFFLANQEFITGQVLGVDGGFLL